MNPMKGSENDKKGKLREKCQYKDLDGTARLLYFWKSIHVNQRLHQV